MVISNCCNSHSQQRLQGTQPPQTRPVSHRRPTPTFAGERASPPSAPRRLPGAPARPTSFRWGEWMSKTQPVLRTETRLGTGFPGRKPGRFRSDPNGWGRKNGGFGIWWSCRGRRCSIWESGISQGWNEGNLDQGTSLLLVLSSQAINSMKCKPSSFFFFGYISHDLITSTIFKLDLITLYFLDPNELNVSLIQRHLFLKLFHFHLNN